MKRYEVYFSTGAVADLDRVYLYVAEGKSQEAALRYLGRLEKVCFSLATLPQRGTAVKGKFSGCRKVGFERKATILFRIGEDSAEILRILHYGRDVFTSREGFPEQ